MRNSLAERSEVHESAGALEVALRSARQQLIQLQEHKGRLEVRVTQLDMRMENLRNHVSQRYQIDLEAFEPDSYTLVTSLRERNKKKAHDAQAGGLRGSRMPAVSAGTFQCGVRPSLVMTPPNCFAGNISRKSSLI